MKRNYKHKTYGFAVVIVCLALLLNVAGCRSSKPDVSSAIPSGTENLSGTGDNAGSNTDNNTGNNTSKDADNNIGNDANNNTDNNTGNDADNNTGTDNNTDKDNGSEPENTVTQAPRPKIDDNGKPVTDFDEFVNGSWKREQEALDKGNVYAWSDETTHISDRVREMLDDTDISELSADDGLYKAVMIYRSLTDIDDMQARLATVREHIAPIAKVRTPEDLYKLYADEEYLIYNALFRFEVKGDVYGNNMLNFCPISLTESIRRNMPQQESEEDMKGRERFMSFMNEIGFTTERADELLKNALKTALILDEYPQKNSDGNYSFYYFTEEDFLEAGPDIPVFDILREINALGVTEGIMADPTCFELLGKLYTPENTEILRDYLLYDAVITLYGFSGYKILFDVPDYDHDKQIVSMMMGLAGDVLAEEYLNKYQSEDLEENIRVFTAEVKEAAKEVIYEAEWLTAYGREEARAKLMRMRSFAGKNGFTNDLKDVVLSDNAIESIISLYKSHDRFVRSQTAIEGDPRRIFDCYMFDENGVYFPGYNAFTLTAGLLADPLCASGAEYEERLAALGFVIAHEMSHAFDPQNIDNDGYGYYNPWMKEEEMNAYARNIERLVGFYDGLDAGYGRTVSGSFTATETFADLMAVRICLKILSERENPDYDLFFRTLAKRNAAYYTEEGMDEVLADKHLPSKIRINCILGQFDKFYEIYDIDGSSPYYVPESERLKAF